MIWLTDARQSHAAALSMVLSKALARRRLRFSPAKVRSTTHRLGSNQCVFVRIDAVKLATPVYILDLRRAVLCKVICAIRITTNADAKSPT